MIFRHRTQPKREEGEEGWEGEEGRREGFVLLEVPYKLRFRTPTCLGSYSCCNNLLGILLQHPSRTAATRGRKKKTQGCDNEQSTHYQVAFHAPRGRPS